MSALGVHDAERVVAGVKDDPEPSQNHFLWVDTTRHVGQALTHPRAHTDNSCGWLLPPAPLHTGASVGRNLGDRLGGERRFGALVEVDERNFLVVDEIHKRLRRLLRSQVYHHLGMYARTVH